MAIYYECDRCGDLYNSAENSLYLRSKYLSIDQCKGKSTIDLCPECQKPLLIFLHGFLNKANKNFAIDRQIEKAYN